MSKPISKDRGELNRAACVTYLQTHGVYSGHSRDGIDQLRQAVAQHQANPEAEHHTPDVAPTPPHPSGPDRVAAAKTEHKTLQKWAKDGEWLPKPHTPNLDALNAEHAAGSTAAERHRKARSTRKPAEVQEAPKPGSGFTVLQLRNDKQATEVAKVLRKGKGQSYVDGTYLVVRTTEGQAVFDQFVAAAVGADIMYGRRMVLAQLLVRSALPKITDDRKSLVARVANALTGRDWSAPGAPDSTPTFVVDGTTYRTARDAATAVGVSAKAEKAVAA